jgi:glucose-6-phosphate isomerase
MQSGDIINFIEGFPSEQRAVLHTATRDFFENPNQAPEAVKAAKEALQEINKLKAFINKIDAENKWEHILVVGIGGSELGPKAHY